MKLESHKVRKMADPNFWKKHFSQTRMPQKGPKMVKIWGFQGFDKKRIDLRAFFTSIWKWQLSSNFIKKSQVKQEYGPKTSRRIQIQNSSNCNISKISWGLKPNFYIWLDLHRNNKYRYSFQVSVIRHTWLYLNIYLKNE